MKILIIHQYFLEEGDHGGSRWNELSKIWSENGHEIHVISGMMHANGDSKRTEYDGVYYLKKLQGNVQVHRTHVSANYNNGFIGRLMGYFSFMFSSAWFGLTKVHQPFDIILVTSPPLFVGISGYLLSKFKKIPMIFEVRDLWPESAIDTGVLKNKAIIKLSYIIESFIYSRSILISVLTPAFRDVLISKKEVNKDKIIFVPNAADFRLVEEVKLTFNRELFRKQHELEGKFVITYVGAHGIANHLEQVLYSAELLKDTDVVFLLIGEGMRKNALIDLRDNMSLNNVRFIDPVPKADVFKYILASEMGISVLKKVDTFKTVYSNKTFDYMSCNIPILMAIDGVSRELVESADAGSYVEPENIHEFNRVIRKYLADPKLLQSQGINGYDYAKANFDRKVLAERYIDSIEKLIHSNC